MANPQMILIGSNTVGAGGAASVTFSSIPQTYTDLMVLISSRATTGSFPNPLLQFNGSSAASYAWRGLYADGVGTTSSNNSSSTTALLLGVTDGSSQTANTFGNLNVYIPNYASSNYKSISVEAVSENNATTSWLYGGVAGVWANTAAITSLTFTPGSGNFEQYSSFYLYGIQRQ